MIVYVNRQGINLCYIYKMLCYCLRMCVSVVYTLIFEYVCEYMRGDVIVFILLCVLMYINMS